MVGARDYRIKSVRMSQGGGTQRGQKLTKRIVIGSVSHPIADRAENDPNSHLWTVYIKPYYNEDLTSVLSKVQFTLHESYAVPIREVTEPPYEITESGWGEFEIGITLYFVDNVEKPVTLYHVIRLFAAPQCDPPTQEKPLVSENYEELVFVDPPEILYNKLVALENDTTTNKTTFQHHSNWEAIIEHTKQLLNNAQNKIVDEIAATKRRIEEVKEENELLKKQITSSANPPKTDDNFHNTNIVSSVIKIDDDDDNNIVEMVSSSVVEPPPEKLSKLLTQSTTDSTTHFVETPLSTVDQDKVVTSEIIDEKNVEKEADIVVHEKLNEALVVETAKNSSCLDDDDKTNNVETENVEFGVANTNV